MIETWAHCATCDRRYYVPSEPSMADSRCPVCQSNPARIDHDSEPEDQASGLPPSATV